MIIEIFGKDFLGIISLLVRLLDGLIISLIFDGKISESAVILGKKNLSEGSRFTKVLVWCFVKKDNIFSKFLNLIFFQNVSYSHETSFFICCQKAFTVVADLLYYPPYFYLCNKFFAQANSPTPGDLSKKSLSQYGG